jgi:hypothetical protein
LNNDEVNEHIKKNITTAQSKPKERGSVFLISLLPSSIKKKHDARNAITAPISREEDSAGLYISPTYIRPKIAMDHYPITININIRAKVLCMDFFGVDFCFDCFSGTCGGSLIPRSIRICRVASNTASDHLS